MNDVKIVLRHHDDRGKGVKPLWPSLLIYSMGGLSSWVAYNYMGIPSRNPLRYELSIFDATEKDLDPTVRKSDWMCLVDDLPRIIEGSCYRKPVDVFLWYCSADNARSERVRGAAVLKGDKDTYSKAGILMVRGVSDVSYLTDPEDTRDWAIAKGES